MGYELDAVATPFASRLAPRERGLDARCAELVGRLQRAEERIASASIACTSLRGHVPADDPALVAARLRLAQAHLRRREVAEAIERLEDEFDSDLWR